MSSDAMGFPNKPALIPYNIQWTTSGTAPTLGNGILYGNYSQMGPWIDCSIYLELGSTTSGGTGEWRFSLPKIAANAPGGRGSNRQWLGNVWALNTGTAYYVGVSMATESSTYLQCFNSGSGSAYSSGSSIPFSWSSGCVLAINLRYLTAQ